MQQAHNYTRTADLTWKKAIFELSCASVSKRVLEQHISYESEFDVHGKEHRVTVFAYEWLHVKTGFEQRQLGICLLRMN